MTHVISRHALASGFGSTLGTIWRSVAIWAVCRADYRNASGFDSVWSVSCVAFNVSGWQYGHSIV